MIIALLLCFACLTPHVARSQETKPKASIDSLIENLANEQYANRELAQEALLERAIINLDEVIKKVAIAERSDNPEISARSSDLLRSIYRLYHLYEGISEHGLTLGWMVTHDGKTISAEPHITAVKKGSPAEKCGCKAGDVIQLFQGKPTIGKNSRNLLARQLSIIKPGEEITLGLRVVLLEPGREIYLNTYYHRTHHKTVKLRLAPKDNKAPKKPINAKDFNQWLSGKLLQ